MVGNLFVVAITGFVNLCKKSVGLYIFQIIKVFGTSGETVKIFGDFLGNSRRQHTRICTRVCNEFFLIQILHNLQRLVGRNLKQFGTFVLQLREVEKQRRILLFLLFFDAFNGGGHRRRLQIRNQFFSIRLLLETVFFVQFGTIEIRRTFHRPPFAVDGAVANSKIAHNAVKSRFLELPDFPFPAHHHTKHARHHAPDSNHGVFVEIQVVFEHIAVFDGQNPRKIDAHQIVLLCAEICSVRKVVVSVQWLSLADSTADFLLGLRIYPNALAEFFGGDVCHHIHKPVNILSLAPGVGADVYAVHILAQEQCLNNVKLFLHVGDDFVQKFIRDKGQRLLPPTFQIRIINLRVTHSYEVSHAPSNDGLLPFEITVVFGVRILQRLRKLLSHRWLLSDK